MDLAKWPALVDMAESVGLVLRNVATNRKASRFDIKNFEEYLIYVLSFIKGRTGYHTIADAGMSGTGPPWAAP